MWRLCYDMVEVIMCWGTTNESGECVDVSKTKGEDDFLYMKRNDKIEKVFFLSSIYFLN